MIAVTLEESTDMRQALPLLDEILVGKRQEVAPDMSEADFFEFFCAEHILKDYQVSPGDIETGLVGDEESNKTGSDGGIDGFYVLVDKVPINDLAAVSALKAVKHQAQIDVVIIQASRETGFTMDRILRLKDTSENIFSLDREQDKFTESYNEPLLDAIARFRAVHAALAVKSPILHVTFIYATKGDTNNVAPDIRLKSDDFADNAKARLLGSISLCVFKYFGARELYVVHPAKLDTRGHV